MVVGYACDEQDAHAYVKFLAPVSCKFCTAHHDIHKKRPLAPCVLFVDGHQYQMISTYTGMALPDRIMGKDKPIHGAAIVQLDDRENYNDVSAFLQQHLGTIAALAHTFNVSPGGLGVLSRTLKSRRLTMHEIAQVYNGTPRYNEHIEGYSLATQWKLLSTEPYEPSEEVLELQVTHASRQRHLKALFKAFKLGTYKSRLDRDKFIGPMPRPTPKVQAPRQMRNGTFDVGTCIPKAASVLRAFGFEKRTFSRHFARSLFHPRRPLETLGAFLGVPEPTAPFGPSQKPSITPPLAAETSTDPGKFGWCVVCRKPAPHYCVDTQDPVCGHPCKFRNLERIALEQAAKAEWNSFRTEVKVPAKPVEEANRQNRVGVADYLSRIYMRNNARAPRRVRFATPDRPPVGGPEVLPKPQFSSAHDTGGGIWDVCFPNESQDDEWGAIVDEGGVWNMFPGGSAEDLRATAPAASAEDLKSTEPAAPLPPDPGPPPGLGQPVGPVQQVKKILKGIQAMREADINVGKRHYYLNRMRRLWQFIEEHGTLPSSLLISSDGALLDHILKGKSKDRYEKLVKSMTEHSVIVNREVQTRDNDVNYMSNPKGQKFVVDKFASAGCNGLITVPPTVHKTTDKRSVLCAADVRMIPDVSKFYIKGVDGAVDPEELIKRCNLDGNHPNATEEPDIIRCRVDEEPYGKFMGFCKKFRDEYINNKRFTKIYNHLFSDKSVFELDLGKFTKEAVAEAVEECYLYRNAGDVPVRVSTEKLETVFKMGKPGRLVQDCGIYRLLLAKVAGKILSEFVFGKAHGLFYYQSIKERNRETLVQEFLEHLSNPWNEEGMEEATPSELFDHVKYTEEQNRRKKKQGKHNRRKGKHATCMVELDQTKMESHEDIDKNGQGLLSGIYMLLRKVAEMSARKLAGMFGWTLLQVLDGDEKDGLVLKFKMKAAEGGTEHIYMKFDRLFLDSGWLLTSLTNFFNEFVGFYCTVTKNPNHLMAPDKDGEYRLRTGDFDWEFESVPLYQNLADKVPMSCKIRLRIYTEGDDLAGAASRLLADPRNSGVNGIIVRLQEALGYNAKFVVTINGRLEMVGTHFKAVDGRLSYKLPPSPDLKKAICKLGCRTSHNLDPAADVCQKLSMAMSLDGSVTALSDAYMKLSENLLKNGKLNKTAMITFDGFCATSRVFGLQSGEQMSLAQVLDKANARDKKDLPAHVQAALMENSFSAPGAAPIKFRVADLGKLAKWADKCADPAYNQEDSFHHLPLCLRDFFSR
jgi:hypothetical protein